MTFCQLSSEVVLLLAECTGDRELNGLARTCRTLYRFLNPFLYSRDVRNGSYSALRWATKHVEVKTAKLSLDAGADANWTMKQRRGPPQDWGPPLKQVVRRWAKQCAYSLLYPTKPVQDHMAMIHLLLLENGAELRHPEAQGLLILAAIEDNLELTQLVFAYGANLDLTKGHRVRCLQEVAVRGGRREALQAFFDHGFTTNCFSLHVAAESRNVAVAKLLLERGADVKARDSYGEMPLQSLFHFPIYGYRRAVREMVRLLVDYGADVETNHNGRSLPMLLGVMACEDDSLTSYLIESGANVHKTNHDGRTYLHTAMANSQVPISVISKLADMGVDVKARDKNGHTVLHSAMFVCWHRMRLYKLLQLPVDLDARTNEGETALHLTIHNVYGRRTPRGAQMLVEAGADVNAQRTSDGFTTLHIAAQIKHKAMVKQLLESGADVSIRARNGKRALDLIRELQHEAQHEAQRETMRTQEIETMLLSKDTRISKALHSKTVDDAARPVKGHE